MKRRLTVLALGIAVTASTAPAAYDAFPEVRGPYFGQVLPQGTVQVFAPGLIKPPDGFHSSILFSRSGHEAWWTAMGSGRSYYSSVVDGVWTPPAKLHFDEEYGVREPMLSPDERRLYFLSRRPLDRDPVERERIWFVERVAHGWSPPRIIDELVTAHPTHWQFSFTDRGDLYFMSEIGNEESGQDIYRARWLGRGFARPERLRGRINTHHNEFCPFVGPDESYLLFARTPADGGRSDLFISFVEDGGSWSEALRLEDAVNSAHNEVSPLISPDGRYLLFLRVSSDTNEVWWTSASFIEEMRAGRGSEVEP